VTPRSTIRDPRAAAAQGSPAGIVSRIAADAIDLGVLQVLFLGCLLAIAVVRFLLQRHNFSVGAPEPVVTLVGEWLLLVVYLGSGWSTTGRTIGKTVLGLRVLAVHGEPLGPARAFGRAAMCASFYPGLLWIAVSRRNAALHDVAFHSQVVYDWRASTNPGSATVDGTRQLGST
jgi:uncharacterized RDD family membrane protein YckC